MPIEIKELIIKTTIEGQREEPLSPLEKEQEINALKKEILEECKELIRKTLEKRAQR